MKRKDFIKTSVAASLGATLIPKWIQPLMGNSDFLRNRTDDRILVFINLGGGNDGLNTVIPYSNDIYYNLRPNIAIPQNNLIPLNENLGLNSNLSPLQQFWDNGQMLIMQNVGYDQQNLSHFRSTDIWRTATDADTYVHTGWLGRYLEGMYPNVYSNPEEHPLALQQGSSSTLQLTGDSGTPGVVVDDPSNFYSLVGDTYVSGLDNDPPETFGGDELSFIRQVDQNSFQYAEVIQNAANNGSNSVEYPQSQLSQQLSIIARLISGGMYTPIFLAHHYGYDTHADQIGAHSNLLTELSSTISAFLNDLNAQGLSDKVSIITTSEFGRRPFENGSFGTDHGAGSPLFVIGENVNGGIMGSNPDLELFDNNYNLLHQYDFRQIYSTVLKTYFNAPSNIVNDTVLFQDFGNLSIFNLNQLGDINFDGEVNVIDVVMMVNFILDNEIPTTEQFATADINSDGSIDVLDIILNVNNILNGQLSSNNNSNTKPELIIYNGTCSIKNAQSVAGIQIEINSNFKLNKSLLPSGWDIYHNDNKILLFNKSSENWLDSQELFNFTGVVKIENIIFANPKGEKINGDISELPNNFIVHPVYPNPFNPKTNLSFEISKDQFINIELFNLKGRKVKSLASRKFNLGTHNISIDGSFLTSGIYLVKIKSNQIDQTLKLYLIK